MDLSHPVRVKVRVSLFPEYLVCRYLEVTESVCVCHVMASDVCVCV